MIFRRGDLVFDDCGKAEKMPQERPPSSSSSGATAEGKCRGDDYIEHRVSKLDTLAGVAIKYGVEVADVKRANGLGTDLHMFGHQTLRIPVRGRHAAPRNSERQEASRLQRNFAPSPIVLAGPTQNPESSYREKKTLSSAMNLLRGYYGLSSPAQQSSCTAEGMELTSCRSEGDDYSEDEPMSPLTPPSTLKSHTSVLSNGKASANASTGKVMSRLSNEYTPESVSVFGVGDVDKSSEPSVRRRSKVDGMGPLTSPEMEIKQDTADPPDKALQNSIGTDIIGSRTAGFLKVFDGGGKSKDEPISKVIKSMSTSNLQDQTSLQANSSGVKYSSKLDAKSANQIQPISRSLFEGLSKPAIPRYKEALD